MPSNYPDGVNGSEEYFMQDAEIIEEPDIEGDIRRLAVAQALYKTIAPMVATKDACNLRGAVDAHFKALYAKTLAMGAPVKSFDVLVDGTKVGTYSITPKEAVPERDETEMIVSDADALMRWAMEHGCVAVNMNKVNEYIDETGELPDGMEPRKVHRPAVHAGIKSTALKIDPAKVDEALHEELVAQTVEFLTEGGEQ